MGQVVGIDPLDGRKPFDQLPAQGEGFLRPLEVAQEVHLFEVQQRGDGSRPRGRSRRVQLGRFRAHLIDERLRRLITGHGPQGSRCRVAGDAQGPGRAGQSGQAHGFTGACQCALGLAGVQQKVGRIGEITRLPIRPIKSGRFFAGLPQNCQPGRPLPPAYRKGMQPVDQIEPQPVELLSLGGGVQQGEKAFAMGAQGFHFAGSRQSRCLP